MFATPSSSASHVHCTPRPPGTERGPALPPRAHIRRIASRRSSPSIPEVRGTSNSTSWSTDSAATPASQSGIDSSRRMQSETERPCPFVTYGGRKRSTSPTVPAPPPPWDWSTVYVLGGGVASGPRPNGLLTDYYP
eukprot:gene9207-biopygen2802